MADLSVFALDNCCFLEVFFGKIGKFSQEWLFLSNFSKKNTEILEKRVNMGDFLWHNGGCWMSGPCIRAMVTSLWLDLNRNFCGKEKDNGKM